jgi:hypothetical protein
MPREFNTQFREPWNPIIKKCVDAIDLHTKLYLETGDPFHSFQCNLLRQYLYNLKDWIHQTEPEGWHKK